MYKHMKLAQAAANFTWMGTCCSMRAVGVTDVWVVVIRGESFVVVSMVAGPPTIARTGEKLIHPQARL